MKRKPKIRVLKAFASPMRVFKSAMPSVDLGALQNEFTLASRDAKAKAKALSNAENANDNAKVRLASAREKLSSASRAVIADS